VSIKILIYIYRYLLYNRTLLLLLYVLKHSSDLKNFTIYTLSVCK